MAAKKATSLPIDRKGIMSIRLPLHS